MDTALLPYPIRDALIQFPLVFHDDGSSVGPIGIAWAPGRVNLIGEHTDYNDGFVLPLAIDRIATFVGRRRGDKIIRLWSRHFNEGAEFSLDNLPATFEQQRAPRWARYILGVVAELAGAGITLNGFDAVVGGDVPLGGGLSSSAALEIATVQACILFSEGKFTLGKDGAMLTPLQVAKLCQHAEHRASGVKCGILDQAASCLGQPKKAILLDCRSLEYRYLDFDTSEISLVVIDTGVRRELATSAYNERRMQCEEAAQRLREVIMQHEPDSVRAREIRALRDIIQEQFERYKHYLPEILCRRAGYVIAENERVLHTARLLEMGEVEAVGPILWQGHAGLRDEYEVSCLELDTLVEIAKQVPGVLGARMLGGGFGGCTINLVLHEAIGPLCQAVEQLYPTRTGLQASVEVCHAAGGPGYAWVNE